MNRKNNWPEIRFVWIMVCLVMSITLFFIPNKFYTGFVVGANLSGMIYSLSIWKESIK